MKLVHRLLLPFLLLLTGPGLVSAQKPLGAEFLVSSPVQFSGDSQVATNAAGELVVSWIREDTSSGTLFVYARRYGADGRPGVPVPAPAPTASTGPNQVWSMDFVADQLADGRRFRSLTVLDIYTRECLAIESEQRLKSEDVVLVLNRIKIQRGVPKFLYCDNGSEFSSQAMDLWAYQNGVRMAFSRPGKPTDNAFVESFNGTFRAECLNAHWFTSLTEAQQIVETWRMEYNESHPHRALGEKTPNEFAKEIAASRDFLESQIAENSP